MPDVILVGDKSVIVMLGSESQLSVAVAVPVAPGSCGAEHSTVTLAGAVTTGAWPSLTVTVCVAFAVLPLLLVTVKVTVSLPFRERIGRVVDYAGHRAVVGGRGCAQRHMRLGRRAGARIGVDRHRGRCRNRRVLIVLDRDDLGRRRRVAAAVGDRPGDCRVAERERIGRVVDDAGHRTVVGGVTGSTFSLSSCLL